MNEIIKQVYGTNFGTAYEVYKEAAKKDNRIRLQDVKDYLNSREDKQTQFKYKNYNSCVGPGAKFELKIYIMDAVARDGGDGIRYGLCAIDNFTKTVSVIPIKKPITLRNNKRLEVNN